MSGSGDYISREAAIDDISSRLNLTDLEWNPVSLKNIRAYVAELINHVPAADAIEKMPRWIPVTERLPREQETVLTWGKQGVILLDWRHDNKWCCFGDVTHWLPLPEPPKEED